MTSSSEMNFPVTTKAYELFEEIGGGVSSIVYRARCIASDEIVAIKILDLEKCKKDVETIREEVRVMSSNDHTNLLRPHCYFEDGSSFWIVMPYTSENPVCEEETLEPKLFSSDKQMDELQDNKAMASGIPQASPNATEIIPLLQNLMLLNDSQRERLTGLVQLYDQTAGTFSVVQEDIASSSMSREAVLLSEIDFLKQSVEKLEEEVEKQKKINAQLEDQINRLVESSTDPA
ncbi:unnamed protein product [Cochlearia groenlandica]